MTLVKELFARGSNSVSACIDRLSIIGLYSVLTISACNDNGVLK